MTFMTRPMIRAAAREALADVQACTVYLSGPMTGVPNMNAPAFMQAENELAEHGFTAFNPAANQEPNWPTAMEQDFAALSQCGAVLALTDWQVSVGARLEVFVARAMELPVISLAGGMIPPELIDGMTRSPMEQLVVNQAMRLITCQMAVTSGLWK